MRKIYLVVLLLLSGMSAFAQCGYLVNESFETQGFVAPWTLPGTYTYTYSGVSSPVGTYHAEIFGGGSHYAGAVYNFTPSTPTYISWWGKTPASNVNGSYVVIGDASTSSNNGIMFFYFKATGTMLFYNGINNYEVAAQANQWYHFELKNIDYVNKVFDIYVDGIMVRQGHQFRSQSTTDISQIHLYNFSSSITGYYDEIIIGTQPLEATGAGSDVSCSGGSNGSAYVSVVSGQAPFTYSWNNGGTTDTINGLVWGTYEAILTGGNGCSDTVSILINEPTAVSGTFNSVDPLCSYSTDGSLEIVPSGGTPGYTYMWSNGDSVSLAQGLSGGTYSVIVTDSNGCTFSDTMTLNAPSAILTSGTVTDEVGGVSLGAIDLQVSGGMPGYLYSWSTGDTTEDVQGLVAGTYTVVVTDTNGCTAIDTFVVDFLVSNSVMADMNVTVWPVPFDASFTIDIPAGPDMLSVELIDLRGAVLIRKKFDAGQSHDIQTQDIASGTYLLRISDGEKAQVLRLVKN